MTGRVDILWRNIEKGANKWKMESQDPKINSFWPFLEKLTTKKYVVFGDFIFNFFAPFSKMHRIQRILAPKCLSKLSFIGKNTALSAK